MSLFEDNATEQTFNYQMDDDPYGMGEEENPFGLDNSEESTDKTYENEDEEGQDNEGEDKDVEVDFDAVFEEETEEPELEFHDSTEVNETHESHLDTESLFYIPESKDSVCMKLPDETMVTYNHTIKVLEFKTDLGTFINSSFVPPDPRETTSLPSPVIKSIHIHSLCTIERKQATDNARKDRYDLKEYHDQELTRESVNLAKSLTISDYENLDDKLKEQNSHIQYLGKVNRDHTLELHVPLTEDEIGKPNVFHRTYYMQCEDSTEEASWFEAIKGTIKVYRDIEKEDLEEKMQQHLKEQEEERRRQVDEELKNMNEAVANLSVEEEEKARKEREEELAKQARRAAKKPIDINALIRKSNHPDMSVMYYQKLLYTDMTEDELLPYIYLFYDKVKEVCVMEEF